jgi:osmotically-inducible protein OsmY
MTQFFRVAMGAVLLVGVLAFVGCQGEHPDVKQAVYSALSQHDLASVEVFQDRRKGEITLRGIVSSADLKNQAETIARQTAPGYTIKDQIQVQTAGIQGMEQNPALDNAIEDRFRATLEENKRLETDGIRYSADNRTLYLNGSVKSERAKKEAESLAKKVPDVQHVVNDLAVKPS